MNNDGKPDIVVGNYSVPNFLCINKGDGIFDDQSYVSGIAPHMLCWLHYFCIERQAIHIGQSCRDFVMEAASNRRGE
ncbi:MAG TPA: VCBS repeat-containing protein [Acidisarcina sp.]|nr:VCBS repeat-containing protein [Acidisarcina sp.]